MICCTVCGSSLTGDDFRAFPTLGDCHPLCEPCARQAGKAPRSGRTTLVRELYAAGRPISRCQCCGGEGELDVHFIIPLARGGSAETGNLLILCPGCHELVHRGARLKGKAVVITEYKKRGAADEKSSP